VLAAADAQRGAPADAGAAPLTGAPAGGEADAARARKRRKDPRRPQVGRHAAASVMRSPAPWLRGWICTCIHRVTVCQPDVHARLELL